MQSCNVCLCAPLLLLEWKLSRALKVILKCRDVILKLMAGLKIEGILKLKMVLKCRDHCICNFQPNDIASLS